MYCVSAWSPGICPVVPACLVTMTLPFVQVTSYVYLQAPLADGGDQERATLGGILPSRVGDSGGPGQAVANNTNKVLFDAVETYCCIVTMNRIQCGKQGFVHNLQRHLQPKHPLIVCCYI